MRAFDVAHHQPHPPGYPLFIVAAKAMHAVVTPEWKALGAVSVVAAALGIVAIFALFRQLIDPAAAFLAAFLAATTPLYWFTAARPLSDSSGLAAALVIQALILAANSSRALAIAAFAAGLGTGIRSQVMWLTVPLLLAVGAWRLGTGSWGFGAGARGLGTGAPRTDGPRTDAPCTDAPCTDAPRTDAPCTDAPRTSTRHPAPAPSTQHPALSTLAAFTTGALVWFVPLVIVSGGLAAYWQALFAQGAEDLSGIQMLWTSPRLRTLIDALYYAFVAPWANWLLAIPMLLAAAAGVIVLARRNRRALLLLVIAFGPYFLFDILFQETFTVRYALPIAIPIAALAAVAIVAMPQMLAVAAALLLAMYGAHIGGRSIAAYSAQPAPVFRLLADIRSEESHDRKPVLAPDRRASFDLRRPIVWLGAGAPAFEQQLAAPPQHEWREAVKYWNGGGRAPVWFVVDPRRAAVDLIQHDAGRPYEWNQPYPVLMAGTRPYDLTWYQVDRPEWFVGDGWSLTPEAAGVSQELAAWFDLPREAWVHRSLAGGALVLGGRNFDQHEVELSGFVGQLRLDQTLPIGPFLKLVRLPVGLSDGRSEYVRLAVSAGAVLGKVALEQFDASATRGVIGFGSGWYEREFNPQTGRQWRWLGDRGELQYLTNGHPVQLRITGESPRKYYPTASRLVVRTADRSLLDTTVADDFTVDVEVPQADQVATLIVETNQTHVPAERSWRGSADRRRLGLRIYTCELRNATASVPDRAASSPPGR